MAVRIFASVGKGAHGPKSLILSDRLCNEKVPSRDIIDQEFDLMKLPQSVDNRENPRTFCN